MLEFYKCSKVSFSVTEDTDQQHVLKHSWTCNLRRTPWISSWSFTVFDIYLWSPTKFRNTVHSTDLYAYDTTIYDIQSDQSVLESYICTVMFWAVTFLYFSNLLLTFGDTIHSTDMYADDTTIYDICSQTRVS